MKWHLNIILAIINFSIFGYIIFCLSLVFILMGPLITDNSYNFQSIIQTEYFSEGVNAAPYYVEIIFTLLNLLIHLFLIQKLLLARKIVSKIYSGEIIYRDQSSELRQVGTGFTVFAKLKYSLLMITGVFFYLDIHIFLKALPQFLLFYLLGKLILIISIITSKSEVLQQENELTI